MITANRCQIREAAEPGLDSRLRYHVANVQHLPACGTPVRPWHGRDMQAVDTGPGEVTCARRGCAE
jgi:hypothetical protein